MADDQGGRPYDPNELQRMKDAMLQAQAGGGSRFDVINREHDALAAVDDEKRNPIRAVNASHVSEIHAALAEFLRRMNSIDNRGASETFRVGS